MSGAAFLPILLLLVPGKPPAQVAPRGAIVDRDSQPVHIIADGKGGARILLDESIVPGLKEAAMTELTMLPGTVVPEHAHDTSAELIYIVSGTGTMVLDGKESMVRAGMAIYIPAGVKHSLSLNTKIEPLRAIQVYTPGGPQERFKAGPITKE